MIKHIVMVRLKDTVPAGQKKENAARLKKAIEALMGRVPELKGMEVGLNLSTRPRAYDLVLTSLFDSMAALDAYRIHPEHQKVLELLYEVMDETAVVDYEY